MKSIPLVVLVIDDDHGDRLLVRRSLGETSILHELLEADTIQAALSTYKDRKIDFILSDQNLPDGMGVDQIETYAATWPTVAIAIMTGLGNETIAASAIKSGAVDYIPKQSVTPRALQRMIETGVHNTRMQTRIDEQNEELRNFTHVLVHDFKAPLRGIGLLAGMIREDVEMGEHEDLLDHADEMANRIERLGRLIDSLLANAGLREDPVQELADIGELVEAAVTNLENDISDAGGTVKVEGLPSLKCVAPEIIQLFQNLIGNAIKYRTDAAPEVRIFHSQPDPHFHLLMVCDNGPGIPADKADYVFEPFKRLHTQEERPGTGLGLHTCRKIVARHGGRIWCSPNPTGGTTIQIALPSLASPAQADASSASQTSA